MRGSGTARIYGIGHSTRSIEEFIELLRSHGVATVADVRSIPGSRKFPQFNSEPLRRALADAGIEYQRIPLLGGRRSTAIGKSDASAAWRNPSFRAYAEYMQTPEFEEGLRQLLRLARDGPVAVLCAEAVPWRCHRSLIADALVARGIEVDQIISGTRATPHRLTPFAHLDGTHVTYPAEAPR